MENKWNILKEKLNTQVEDCRKHRGCSGNWNVYTRAYQAVLNLMEAIENDKHDTYNPCNGGWTIDEEQ